MPADKLPFIQLYPGDWLRDSVSGCTLAAQGLWLRMMLLAHDSERYGYLSINGSPMPPETIARRCGCNLAEYETLFAELVSAGVPSISDKEIIYSRRMVRDASLRQTRAKSGRQGGKASISGLGFVYAAQRSSDGAIKLGASSRPQKRPAELRRHLKGDKVELKGFWAVVDMRRAESVLHGHFCAQSVEGEWFKIVDKDIASIPKLLSDKELLSENGARNTSRKQTPKQAQIPDNEIDIEISPLVAPATKKGASAAGEVISHYLSYHPRSKPGDVEHKKIRDRLAEGFSVEDLKRAIDGCHLSTFHAGDNDSGTKHQSLELIVRDSSKVNMFMEVAEDATHPRRRPRGSPGQYNRADVLSQAAQELDELDREQQRPFSDDQPLLRDLRP